MTKTFSRYLGTIKANCLKLMHWRRILLWFRVFGLGSISMEMMVRTRRCLDWKLRGLGRILGGLGSMLGWVLTNQYSTLKSFHFLLPQLSPLHPHKPTSPKSYAQYTTFKPLPFNLTTWNKTPPCHWSHLTFWWNLHNNCFKLQWIRNLCSFYILRRNLLKLDKWSWCMS